MSDFDITALVERLRARLTPRLPVDVFNFIARIFLDPEDEEAMRRWELLAEFKKTATKPADEEFSADKLLQVAVGISMALHAARHGSTISLHEDTPEAARTGLAEIQARWRSSVQEFSAALRRLIARDLVEVLCGSTDSAIAARMYNYLEEVVSIQGIPSVPNERLTKRLGLVGENLTKLAVKQPAQLYGSGSEALSHSQKIAMEAARLADLEAACLARRAANPVFCCACGKRFIDTSAHSFARRCTDCILAERTTPRQGRFCRRCGTTFDIATEVQHGLGSPYCSPACKSGDNTR